MGGINGVGKQEGANGDVVRKMSDLSDGGLEIIDTELNIFNNELLKILTNGTAYINQEKSIIYDSQTYTNQEIFIIYDSQKMEELYSIYIDLGDYQEALQVCKSVIQREVEREILKGAQSGYNLKTGSYEVNFDTVSTPTALKWKQRIEEIEDISYSKLVESGKMKQALQVCISVIQREVEREILKGAQSGYNLKTGAYEVSFDNISTPTSLKWKQRISKLTR